MPIRELLLILVAGTAIAFTAIWARDVRRARGAGRADVGAPSPVQVLIGFVTNFLDTLGIGSFATTTAAFKTLRMVPDENIPGTMLIGHTLPAVAQAFIFIAAVTVEPVTMLVLITAMVAGGWLGARVSTRLPRRPIQIAMGVGLTLAATFMAASQLGLLPGGGTAIGLGAGRLLLASAGFVLFGAVVMVGIGHFAPSIILLSVLGMDPRAAFPVMMGAGALMAVTSNVTFMRQGRYTPRAALGLALGGIPAVLVAGLIVKSLPLEILRWVVVAVVLYAAAMMLRSAFRGGRATTVGAAVTG